MTVQNTPNFVDYVGDDVTLVFNFTFRVDDIAWLSVDFTDDFDTFAINVDQDASPGGSATYLIAPPSPGMGGPDPSFRVLRSTSQTQDLAYTRYDPFDSLSHESALDKLTMQVQDQVTFINAGDAFLQAQVDANLLLITTGVSPGHLHVTADITDFGLHTDPTADENITGQWDFINTNGIRVFSAGFVDGVQFAVRTGFMEALALGAVTGFRSNGLLQVTELGVVANSLTFGHDGVDGTIVGANMVDIDISGISGRLTQGAEQYAFLSEVVAAGLLPPPVLGQILFSDGALWLGSTNLTWDAANQSLRIGATLFMVEIAAAQPDNLTEGQWWVRNDDPNTPMFTTDLGVDHVLNNVAASTAGDRTLRGDGSGGWVESPQFRFTFGGIFQIRDFALGANTFLLSNNATDAVINTVGLTDLDILGFTTIRSAATLAMLQLAAAPLDVLNYGQFWVRNTLDGEPMFTDDAGVDTVLNSVGAITLTINADINTATPPTTENVTALLEFRDLDGSDLLGSLGYNATEDMFLRNVMRGGEFAIEVTDSVGSIFRVLEANPASETALLGDRTVQLQAGGRLFLVGDGFSSPFELNLYHNDILTAQTAARADGGMELINNFNDAAGAVFVRVLTANDISVGLNVVRYDFSAGIGGAPSNGVYNFNNATANLVTEIRMNDNGEDSINNEWLFPELASGDLLTFRSETQNGDLIIFKVSGVAVDNTGDWSIPVTHVSGGLPTTNAKARMTWQQLSQGGFAAPLVLLDNEQLQFGAAQDVTMDWDGTDFEVEGLASAQAWNFRDGMVINFYGEDNIDRLELSVNSAANTSFLESFGINSLTMGIGNYAVRFSDTLGNNFGQLHYVGGEFVISTGSGDGDIVLLWQGVTRALVAVDHVPNGVTSSGEILDAFGNVRPIGFNLVFPVQDNPVGLTLGAIDVGQLILMDDDTAFTVIVPASTNTDFPVGGITTLINANTAAVDITITDNATGTLFYLDGAAKIDIVGTALLAPGGVANIWRRSTTEWFIWGTGITP